MKPKKNQGLLKFSRRKIGLWVTSGFEGISSVNLQGFSPPMKCTFSSQ